MAGISQKETFKAAIFAHSGRRMERLVDRQEHLGNTQNPGGERTSMLGRTGGWKANLRERVSFLVDGA